MTGVVIGKSAIPTVESMVPSVKKKRGTIPMSVDADVDRPVLARLNEALIMQAQSQPLGQEVVSLAEAQLMAMHARHYSASAWGQDFVEKLSYVPEYFPVVEFPELCQRGVFNRCGCWTCTMTMLSARVAVNGATDREEWHALRERGFGASEVYKLRSGNTTISYQDTIARKAFGQHADRYKAVESAMDRGRRLESEVIAGFAKTAGLACGESQYMFLAPHIHERLFATVDAFAYVQGMPNEGRFTKASHARIAIPFVVEAKTTTDIDPWVIGDIPKQYLWQVQAQLACTNTRVGILAVAFGVQDAHENVYPGQVKSYVIHRSEDVIREIPQLITEAWGFVHAEKSRIDATPF